MERKRFYIDTQGNDDNAYKEAIEHACKLSNEDKSIDRIVLLALTQNNVDWLTRAYGDSIVKDFFKGKKFSNCNAPIKIETIKTYKDGNTNDIVITMALDTEHLTKIEDYYCVQAIIAIPWQKKLIEKWVKSWGPIDIRNNKKSDTFDNPPCVVIKALEELTGSINLTSGITNPHDNNRAKTFIRALHKYNYELDTNKIHKYLVQDLNWDSEHAEDLEKLITTLNEGKHFQGGYKTGLQNYVRQWKEECGE